MTALHIVQQRLHNQRLIGAPFTRPDEAVWWFGAVQAQEYPGAAWGVAQRSDSLTQIAKQSYGNPRAYHRILSANRNLIPDEDMIYEGMRLRIP